MPRKKQLYKTTQKKEEKLIIRGEDLRRQTKNRQMVVSGTGAWRTEKDRPRQRMKVRDYKRSDWE